MVKRIDYPFEIRPLSQEEGGGFLISYPDFSDCLSDGESVEEALENGRDALKSTIAALKAKELPIPAPNSGGVASGKFVARVPKTVHARLATRAKAEGVSLNTLVLTSSLRASVAKNGAHSLAMRPNSTLQRTRHSAHRALRDRPWRAFQRGRYASLNQLRHSM